MTKISPEIARQEIEVWLDYKKVPSKKREDMADTIDLLAEAIEVGVLVRNDNNSITHQLIFPIENKDGEATVHQITYKPRITAEAINLRMKGVKVTETHAMFLAYASALTDQPVQLLKHLDTEDLRIVQSVVAFFL